jgi:hypothetical protein
MHKSLPAAAFAILSLLTAQSAYSQLSVGAGASVTATAGASLVLNNTGLVNNGTVSTNANILFTGNSAGSSTPLSSASSLGNITLSKTGGGVNLGSNVVTANNIQLSGGVVDLNGYNLDLGSTGNILGENATTYIAGPAGGNVLRTISLNAPNAVDPGNIGLEITSASNMGTTVIKRGNQVQISPSGFSIGRYYDIIPTNNSGLNATIKFHYRDAELGSINENELNVYTSTNGVNWTLQGADSRDVTANFVVKGGFNSFNRVTLGSDVNSPLPVQLLSFNASLVQAGVEVKWVTASEINNSHFEIERSENGTSFVKFASVAAQNTGTNLHNYAAIDADPFSGVKYYRLKQVNKDGSFTYSKVVAINKGAYVNKVLNVYPNPASGPVTVSFTSATAAKVMLQVTDNRGRLIINKEFKAATGLNNLVFDVNALASGVYYLRLDGIENSTIKLIRSK